MSKLFNVGIIEGMFVGPVKVLDVSLTSRCNASCPMCRRNVNGGGVIDGLPMMDMSFDLFKERLPQKNIGILEAINICGDFGENTLCRDFIQIIEYIVSNISSGCVLSLDTNGGTRDPEFWKELALYFNTNRRFINFAIDGLENTNHIYRRGVVWNKLIENVKAFTNAGGFGNWCFIPFRHNETQIEEALDLSRSMSLKGFTIRKTNRFRGSSTFPILDKQGREVGRLEQPSDKQLENSSFSRIDLESMEFYVKSTKIKCKYRSKNRLSMNFKGQFLPCCFMAATDYGERRFSRQWKKLLEDTGGVGQLNSVIDGVVEQPFFKELEKSWECTSIEQGRLLICSFFCGESSPQLKKSYIDPETKELVGENWNSDDGRYSD